MISLNFYWAVAAYFFLLLIAVLFAWLFAQKQKDKNLTLDPKFIWHCSVCTYTYINTKEEPITSCPRCGSYNKRDF
jgi:rubrerythrin